jgi:hypothetical protein
MRVFKDRVRRIFVLEKDEVTGEWRRLPSKELYDLYSSPNIWVTKSKQMRWVGCVAYMGGRRGACRVLVGRPEGKRALERPRHRREDNIKINLREVGWDAGQIYLAHNRDSGQAVVIVVMTLQVP